MKKILNSVLQLQKKILFVLPNEKGCVDATNNKQFQIHTLNTEKEHETKKMEIENSRT